MRKAHPFKRSTGSKSRKAYRFYAVRQVDFRQLLTALKRSYADFHNISAQNHLPELFHILKGTDFNIAASLHNHANAVRVLLELVKIVAVCDDDDILGKRLGLSIGIHFRFKC